jgi:homoserine dehydrogenase
MKPVNIGMLGLGTVGSGVVRIVEGHQEDLVRQIGAPVKISKIAVRNLNKTRKVNVDPALLTEDPWEVINDPNIDVVVEVMGGVEHTLEYLLAALERGKHIVTANKDLVAQHGPKILAKAAEKRCDVMYEASVAGGIPILRTLVEGFSSDRITKIMGIVNGTTNYILTKMTQEGASYEAVLAEAQRLGYAEADPTSDVEGYDAAYKMIILGSLGFHVHLSMSDLDVKGISSVSSEDIACAKRIGHTIKLLGIAERQDDLISISVQPTMIKDTHPLASVNGVFNAVYVYGQAVGETMFYGPGAGDMPTATSVVADIVAVSRNLMLGTNGNRSGMIMNEKKLKSDDQIVSKYFMRLQVADRAGVLAQITQIFAEHEISLESVIQTPNSGDQGETEIIIITHNASKSGMNRVLDRFAQIDAVKNVRSVYRVEG